MSAFTKHALITATALLAVGLVWRQRRARIACALGMFLAAVLLAVIPIMSAADKPVDDMDDAFEARCDREPDYCSGWLDGVKAVKTSVDERTMAVVIFMLGLLGFAVWPSSDR
jgi:hypothetical protein